ncbi:MAG: GMP synthase [Alphaproteobacteria bacterium]|nr:GMP synthase [Alphaproteobacteria bacterium]
MAHYKIAILDLNKGAFNWGITCFKNLIKEWQIINNQEIEVKVFDVRVKNEVPDTSYDAYISSGGPGSPLEENDDVWAENYFSWIHKMEQWNNLQYSPKRHVFFVCHSFQLLCRYYKFANVCKRKSRSFGIFTCHFSANHSTEEPCFKNLINPFYIVDSREFQVIDDLEDYIHYKDFEVLALEKNRPHVPLPRAYMSVRFNPFFIGTQFHPEANIESMEYYLYNEQNKSKIINDYGLEKWENMTKILHDDDKLIKTYHTILPNFFNHALLK